jgi:hypothetical protein
MRRHAHKAELCARVFSFKKGLSLLRRFGRRASFDFYGLGARRSLRRLLDADVENALIQMLRIPTQAGRGFRFDPGRGSDLMPATIPR